MAAIVGGTTSEVTGGKFANGAETAAFQYAYNAAGGALAERVQQITRGTVKETKLEKAFDENGQAITKIGQYGTDKKLNLPAQINAVKKGIGKSLNLDIEITIRTTGEFQRYDEFSREVRFFHKYTDSVLTGDTERYYVGPWESTGSSRWERTNINVRSRPVDIDVCVFSC